MLTYFLTHSLTLSLSHSLTHLLIHLLLYSLTYVLTYLLSYLFTYFPSYLLTPWIMVLLENLSIFHLVRNCPSCNESHVLLLHSQVLTFYTYPELARCCLYPHIPLPEINLNIVLPGMPGSPKWSPSLSFPHRKPVYPSPFPHTCYMPRLFHPFRFYHQNNIGWG